MFKQLATFSWLCSFSGLTDGPALLANTFAEREPCGLEGSRGQRIVDCDTMIGKLRLVTATVDGKTIWFDTNLGALLTVEEKAPRTWDEAKAYCSDMGKIIYDHGQWRWNLPDKFDLNTFGPSLREVYESFDPSAGQNWFWLDETDGEYAWAYSNADQRPSGGHPRDWREPLTACIQQYQQPDL